MTSDVFDEAAWNEVDLPAHFKTKAWYIHHGDWSLTLTHHPDNGWYGSWDNRSGKAQTCTSFRRCGPFISRKECIEAMLGGTCHD
jgi:hypothetical protein